MTAFSPPLERVVCSAEPSSAKAIGVFCGRRCEQVWSSVISPTSICVPSLVPSLVKANRAQSDIAISCCCGTSISCWFAQLGLQGSSSFCPNVKFDWSEYVPPGHLTLFEHVMPWLSLLQGTFWKPEIAAQPVPLQL